MQEILCQQGLPQRLQMKQLAVLLPGAPQPDSVESGYESTQEYTIYVT
jgi:hypothetical protein